VSGTAHADESRAIAARDRESPAMIRRDLKVASGEGPGFDCYLATPERGPKVPAIVLASAIHGVDEDLRAIADAFAGRGFVAAAPDLFWRSLPGPLARDDPRASPRGQPRLERINAGERDLADVLRMLRKQAQCNGRAAVIGFCYGGPYAILAPKRLGYDAGISCHGTQMLDFIAELEGIAQPLCFIWGDQDSAAPADVLEAYRRVPSRMGNAEVHVLPGVQHGYMMRGNAGAFDQGACDFSMERALSLLDGLR
jgi:carboxymethylenebutenolidase